MPLSSQLTCTLIPDRLGLYNPYATAYRDADRTLYEDFHPFDPRAADSFLALAQRRAWTGNRPDLASRITTYLESIEAPAASIQNAKYLAREDCWVVVTGHQPGLFGGPLFLLWKLVGTVALCRQLNSAATDCRFVPVYWNGSEDHNRDEYGRASLLDEQHDLVHLALPPAAGSRMAAATPGADAAELLAELRERLPNSEFKNDLCGRLEEAYTMDLGRAMSRLVLSWLGTHGLVVVEPRILREAAAPTIQQALRETDALHASLASESAKMAADGWSPPLPVPPRNRTLVYWVDDAGERHRICTDPSAGFGIEGEEKRFAADELGALVEAEPDRFSPSAALRPAIQAVVLPVVAYAAGGGELAYHRQLRGIFCQLGAALPLLVPRLAGTILKASAVKAMARFDIPAESLLDSGWEWKEIAARATAKGADRSATFARATESLSDVYDHLSDALRRLGHTNTNEVQRERDRACGRLAGLQRRFDAQDPASGEGPRRQYFRLRKLVRPGESYQELSVSTAYFIALFGTSWIDEAVAACDPLSDKHHLFTIG